MSKPVLTEQTVDQFRTRIARVESSEQRRWGVMSAAATCAHLRNSLDVALGNVDVEDMSNIFTRSIVRILMFYVLPFPKNIGGVPDAFFPKAPSDESDLAGERAQLLERIDAFLALSAAEPERKVLHPLFGRQPLCFWRRIHGVHIDHHLRQFGA